MGSMEIGIQPTGGYRYIRGIPAFSYGVIATEGYEVVHATLARPIPWRAGFDLIASHLGALGRPRQALAAIELRSPQPFTPEGFSDFNRGYAAVLETWEILVDGDNPVARTNVAPVVNPPTDVSLYAFSYTELIVGDGGLGSTFVVAGAGESNRDGKTSPDAMADKAASVLSTMNARLSALGVGLADVTMTDVYTAHPVHSYLAGGLLEPMGPAGMHGIHWHHARPPIIGLEYEMDMRGVRRELVVG